VAPESGSGRLSACALPIKGQAGDYQLAFLPLSSAFSLSLSLQMAIILPYIYE
jgi:hypothetical protein